MHLESIFVFHLVFFTVYLASVLSALWGDCCFVSGCRMGDIHAVRVKAEFERTSKKATSTRCSSSASVLPIGTTMQSIPSYGVLFWQVGIWGALSSFWPCCVYKYIGSI